MHDFIKHEDWYKSKERTIDDKTLCDFLGILEYQAERRKILEDVGIEDNGSTEEVLYIYVLDALNVPKQGHVKLFPDGETDNQIEYQFDREYFNELFYSEFLLNNEENKWEYMDVIDKIKEEIRDDLNNHYIESSVYSSQYKFL